MTQIYRKDLVLEKESPQRNTNALCNFFLCKNLPIFSGNFLSIMKQLKVRAIANLNQLDKTPPHQILVFKTL